MGTGGREEGKRKGNRTTDTKESVAKAALGESKEERRGTVQGERKGAPTHYRAREQTHQSEHVQEHAVQKSELGGILQRRGDVCCEEVLKDSPDEDAYKKAAQKCQPQDKHVPNALRSCCSVEPA